MALEHWRHLSPPPAWRARILHVHVLPADYGSGLNTFLSMRYLDRNHFEAALACAPGGRLEERVRLEGFEFVPIPHFVRQIDPHHDARALLELVQVLRTGRYDLVHTHNSKGGFLGRLAARIVGVPAVHTVHGFAFHEAEPLWRQSLFRNIERRAARWADALIAISTPLIEWADRERVAPASRFVRIPSGIEIERFMLPVDRIALRRKLGIGDDELVVGEVAKLWEGKGHRTLLEAFARIRDTAPPVRIVLLGEGPLEGALREQARALGIEDRVTFLGHRNDVHRLLATFDVSVLPSEFEGMGRAILEAMARRVPVVATHVGGIPDLVRDGETGFLVPPRDPDALAGRLLQLLEDDALRVRLGGAAQRAVLDDRTGFDARQMAARIEDVYREVLERPRTARPGRTRSERARWVAAP